MSRRIFSRIFSSDFFSSFLWEKVLRKILHENPLEFIQQKSSNTFLQISQGNNSTQIPENQKPPQTQKLRNSNSETQKVRVSEFPRQSFRVSEAEFPSRTISGSFGVGTKSPKHYVYSGRTHFGSFRAGYFRTKSGNSETPPQKLRNTNSEIGFPSFRVGLSEFPSRTF